MVPLSNTSIPDCGLGYMSFGIGSLTWYFRYCLTGQQWILKDTDNIDGGSLK